MVERGSAAEKRQERRRAGLRAAAFLFVNNHLSGWAGALTIKLRSQPIRA